MTNSKKDGQDRQNETEKAKAKAQQDSPKDTGELSGDQMDKVVGGNMDEYDTPVYDVP